MQGRRKISPSLGAERIGSQLLDLAFQVHAELGADLPERAYGDALEAEMRRHRMPFAREPTIEIWYKGERLRSTIRPDFILAGIVMVELKASILVHPNHRAQAISYLQHSRCELGFLLNFGEAHLRNGIHRFVPFERIENR